MQQAASRPSTHASLEVRTRTFAGRWSQALLGCLARARSRRSSAACVACIACRARVELTGRDIMGRGASGSKELSSIYIMSSTSIAHSAFASCSALTTGPTQAEQEGSAPGPTHRPPMPRVGACESVRRSTSSSAFAIDRRGSMSLVASRVTVVVTRPKVDSPRWGSGRQLWWSRYAFRYTLDLVVR